MTGFDEKRYFDRISILNEHLTAFESNVDYLLLDLRLQEHGTKLCWVLDFSELYRYIHPTLDYARFLNERLFYSEQFAVRSLVDRMPCPKVLLSPYWREYKSHLDRVRRGMTEMLTDVVLEGSLEILKEDASVKQLYSLVNRTETTASYESIKRAVKDLRLSFWEVLGKGLVTDAFERGVEMFEDLLKQGKLVTLRKLGVEYREDVRRVDSPYKGLLDSLNKKRLRHGANVSDAEALTMLSDLNRNADKSGRLFLLVSNTKLLHDVFPKCEVGTIGPGDLPGQIPVIRNLYYFLLRFYFCDPLTRGSQGSFSTCIDAVTKFRGRIDDYKETIGSITKESDVRKLLNRDQAAEKLDLVCDSLQAQLNEIMKLPFSRGHYEFLGERIQLLLRLKGVQKIDTDVVRERLNALTQNPVGIFQDIDKAIHGLNQLITKLEGIVATLLPEEVVRPALGYLYNEKYLMEEDRGIETDLRMIYSWIGSADVADDDKALDRVNELRPFNPKSIALIIAFAIILRRRGFYDKASDEIRKAETIKSEHPEIFFQRAVLLRKIAEDRGEQGAFDQAIHWCTKALGVEPGDPRYLRELAYIYWSMAERTCKDAEGKVVRSGHYTKTVRNSIRFAEAATETLKDSKSKHEKKLLAFTYNDMAYYYALILGRERISEAHDLIRTAFDLLADLGLKIPDSFQDTLGFVTLQKYLLGPEEKDPNLLKTSMAAFRLALRMNPSNSFAMEHLTKACDELLALV